MFVHRFVDLRPAPALREITNHLFVDRKHFGALREDAGADRQRADEREKLSHPGIVSVREALSSAVISMWRGPLATRNPLEKTRGIGAHATDTKLNHSPGDV